MPYYVLFVLRDFIFRLVVWVGLMPLSRDEQYFSFPPTFFHCALWDNQFDLLDDDAVYVLKFQIRMPLCLCRISSQPAAVPAASPTPPPPPPPYCIESTCSLPCPNVRRMFFSLIYPFCWLTGWLEVYRLRHDAEHTDSRRHLLLYHYHKCSKVH